jgi:hypothetical protein
VLSTCFRPLTFFTCFGVAMLCCVVALLLTFLTCFLVPNLCCRHALVLFCCRPRCCRIRIFDWELFDLVYLFCCCHAVLLYALLCCHHGVDLVCCRHGVDLFCCRHGVDLFCCCHALLSNSIISNSMPWGVLM